MHLNTELPSLENPVVVFNSKGKNKVLKIKFKLE